MKLFHASWLGFLTLALFGFSQISFADEKLQDCPLLGPIENYAPNEQPEWRNWDTLEFFASQDQTKKATVNGAVCIQDYAEKEGITDGSMLEIMENYKEAFQKLGAEMPFSNDGMVVGHITKDNQEYWMQVSASRDDGFRVQELLVTPFKRTLLPPSGNDFRLLGHLPGYVAGTPDKKNYNQQTFSTKDGNVDVRGLQYNVDYSDPEYKPLDHRVVATEYIENYREALKDLNAQILRDDPDFISARLEDQGKTIWVQISPNHVRTIEEKAFQSTLVPPTADEMKDKLDKEGHIALYINFDFDKATLKPDAQPIVAQVVDLLKRNPDLKVSIEGHTDSIGGHDYNVNLSQQRAASVVSAITADGIDGSRLTSAGFGPDKPIASNDTDDGRAKNRRVELVKS